MRDNISMRDTVLPQTISPKRNITHLCWHNFGLNEETPSGSGTTQSSHGIVIQERNEQDYSKENCSNNKKTSCYLQADYC